MKKMKKYEDIERRKDPRTEYLNIEGARLKIGEHEFEVLDISQIGLKSLNDEEVNLSEYVSGKLTFLCGESMDIEGSLIWEKGDDFGLYLKNPIPSDVIQKEELYIQEQLSSK
jgi:hypothetical protein